MVKCGLYTNQGDRITITEHKDLKEALEHHSKIKRLPLDVFISLFQVKEIKKDENRSIKS